jgi:carbamate kinase
MVTDVEAAYVDYGKPTQRAIGAIPPGGLERYAFPNGSMGPKVESACMFVWSTGRTAIIGSLSNVAGLVSGTADPSISVERNAVTS